MGIQSVFGQSAVIVTGNPVTMRAGDLASLGILHLVREGRPCHEKLAA